jgi:hypothetical protein
MQSALLVERSLLDEGAAALQARMRLAGVPVIAVDPPFTPKALRLALGGADAGWLICRDATAVGPAATAALTGVVLVGMDPPADDQGLVVARAENIADAPRVMVPRGGGCWHDHRPA